MNKLTLASLLIVLGFFPCASTSQNLTKIVIVGSTGAGKSSLANVLLGESPLCKNCTFPVCPGLHSCTKETSMATSPWLGENDLFTVVDTPGVGDSDNDDSDLIDEMMSVLNKDVGSANLILLLLKGTETRLSRDLQQMIREMRALFGENMWDNLVIGVSFWSFKLDSMNNRKNNCEWSPANCKNKEWFEKSMLKILQEKFHIEQDLPFVFLDSWAKHPMNINDKEQQKMFDTESKKLWLLAKEAKPFDFMTVNDILEENHAIKKRNADLEDMIKNKMGDLRKAVKKIETNVINDKIQISKEVSQLGKGVNGATKKFEDLKNSLAAEIQERINLNSVFRKEMSGNTKEVAQQNIKSAVLDMQISLLNKGQTDQKTEQGKLKQEVSKLSYSNSVFMKDISGNTKEVAELKTKSAVLNTQISFLNKGQTDLNYKLSKLRNRVLTRQECESTSWQNKYDGVLNYKCPDNKVLVRVESVHLNKVEDRIFRFECCHLVLVF